MGQTNYPTLAMIIPAHCDASDCYILFYIVCYVIKLTLHDLFSPPVYSNIFNK